MNTDQLFLKAFAKASNINEKLPQDLMLKLYAYYKQATVGDPTEANEKDSLIDAFKLNAWIQLKGMTADEAKIKYIEIVENL